MRADLIYRRTFINTLSSHGLLPYIESTPSIINWHCKLQNLWRVAQAIFPVKKCPPKHTHINPVHLSLHRGVELVITQNQNQNINLGFGTCFGCPGWTDKQTFEHWSECIIIITLNQFIILCLTINIGCRLCHRSPSYQWWRWRRRCGLLWDASKGKQWWEQVSFSHAQGYVPWPLWVQGRLVCLSACLSVCFNWHKSLCKDVGVKSLLSL